MGEVALSQEERDLFYWVDEFVLNGMSVEQAAALAGSGCDRHAVREALEHGCDPDLAFLIFS